MVNEKLLADIVNAVMARLTEEAEPGDAEDASIEASDRPETAVTRAHVITEADVLAVSARGVRSLRIAERAIVTPLAQDALREKGISLEIGVEDVASVVPQLPTTDRIALGADHGGYELKEAIKKVLAEEGHTVKDFGTFSTESVDYPDFAVQVAEAVASGACYTGIIVDGSAFASAMVANKVPGVLAAACWDLFTAKAAREHANANVLALGGKVTGSALALEMVKVWLDTPFAGGRHERRVEKVREIEERYVR